MTALAALRWHSVSSTRQNEECPRKYWFAYVERVQVDRLVPDAWRFGTVVHAGLEAAYRALGAGESLGQIVTCSSERTRASWSEEQMAADPGALDRAVAIVERAARRAVEETTPADVLGVEHRFIGHTASGRRVIGFADLCLRAGPETVEIRDHKVTSHARSDDELRSDYQLAIYAWLAREEWPWATRVVGSHHYPTLDRIERVELAPADVEQAAEHFEATARTADEDEVYLATPGDHCEWCVYSELCLARAADRRRDEESQRVRRLP